MVGTLTPQRSTMIPLETPSADISTIRACRTNECGKLRERAIESNCSRYAELTLTTVLGLPIGQHHPNPRPSGLWSHFIKLIIH
jgi:hypothetical protein